MHRAAGRAVTARWGEAFLRPDLGYVYDLNLLWADPDAGGLDAAALAAEADRLLGTGGLRHRRILLGGHPPRTLHRGLLELGYEHGRHLYLAHHGAPPPRPAAPVREVAIGALLPTLDRYLRTAPETPYGRHDGVRAQLVEHARTYGAGAERERCYVVDGREGPVAWAKLWTTGSEAQIEDVVVLPDHRGRGFGRDVVAAAARAALTEEPSLLFIVADADDWPKDLYQRLGFQPVGQAEVYLRHDPAAGWSAAPPPG